VVQREPEQPLVLCARVIGSLTSVLVITLTAFAVVREREIGTLEQIMVTPIRPSSSSWARRCRFPHRPLRRLFDCTGGDALVQVPYRGHIAVLFAGSVLFLLCMLAPAAHLHSFLHAAAGHGRRILLYHAGYHVSGFGFPIATMPQWLQYCTYLNPLRYFLVVLRGTYLKGVGIDILCRKWRPWPD